MTLPAGKLVRDRIPEIIEREGRTPNVMRLDPEQMLPALLTKLREECDEVAAAPPQELLGELADVLEVLRALAASTGNDWDNVEKAAERKNEERGGFTERWYLLSAPD
jgi:predicted house-cleaning noncanonical NTP pyrophosphatase (MazG superfamily)